MAARVLTLLLLAVRLAAVVHPAFDLTLEDLNRLARAGGSDLAARVAERPERFLQLLDAILRGDEALYRRVDKRHSLDQDYVPPDLVDIGSLGLPVRRPGMRLRALVVPALASLVAAARRDGVELVISSAFRSWQFQRQLFSFYARRDGLRRAEHFSARAGHSQHQLGTTVDFWDVTNAFAERPEGRWMMANAWRFGFSLSYPDGHQERTGYQWESWHWRYVGYEAAVLQREFFDDLQYRMIDWINDHLTALRHAREHHGP